MKPKIGLLAFLVILLMIPAAVFAAPSQVLKVESGVDAANDFGAGEYGVVGSFKVTDTSGTSSAIQKFSVDDIAGSTLLAADLDSLAIWIDVNRDGILQRGVGTGSDTFVIATSTVSCFDAGGVNAVDLTASVSFSANEIKYFMVVVLAKEDVTDANDGATTDVTVTVTDGASNTGSANVGGAAWQNDRLDIDATHLQWIPSTGGAGYKPLVGAVGGNVIAGGVGALLKAVDDYGNVDKDFDEGVQFKAFNYSSLEDISANLTAQDGAKTDVRVGTANSIIGWASGLLSANTATRSGGVLKVISHSTEGPVVLVARSRTTRLEGSVTVLNAAAYTSTATVNGARGIEIYDRDRDGHIDYATVFYNSPLSVVNAANVRAKFFIVGGTYAIDTNFAPTANFDAGGTGVKNAGEFGVTIKLVESQSYDTDAKPDIYFDGTADLRLIAAATQMSAFSSQGVIEVDKARPRLLKAETKDNDSDGMIDALQFTFTEAVRNVTAGASDTLGVAFRINPSDGVSFTGTPTVSGSVVTIPLTETTPNTGLKPRVWYNQNEVKPTMVTDYATSATLAPAYNFFYPVNTNYSLKDEDAATPVEFDTNDAAAMVVSSVKTLDMGGTAGRIDTMEIVFSESATVPSKDGVGFYSSVPAHSSLTNANGTYAVTGVTQQNASTYRFAITEVTSTDVYDTEALPRFQYSQANGSIVDTAGNELLEYGPGGASHPSTVDGAAPVIVKILTGDAYVDSLRLGAGDFVADGANGRIDNIKVIFSEKVKTGNGAEISGATTALTNVVNRFTLTHSVPAVGARTNNDMTAVKGKPTWTQYDNNGDVIGDAKSELVITFKEASHALLSATNYGDTGATITTVYTQSGTVADRIVDYAAIPNALANVTKASTDGAAPFIVDGLTRGWGTNGFANVLTVDIDSTVMGNTTDISNGNGFIDGFLLKFTEAVNFSVVGTLAAKVDMVKFTTTLASGTLSFKNAYVVGNGTQDVTLYGSPKYDGVPNTADTPVLAYATGGVTVKDVNSAIAIAAFSRQAADGANPVITEVNRGTTLQELAFTFSEDVFGQYANGLACPVDSVNLLSSGLFGYQNNGGTGSSAFTAAKVRTYGTNKLIATVNADVLAADIEVDKVWVVGPGLYDNAKIRSSNVLTANNGVENSASGAGLMVKIFDDVVAPWIIGAWTVDADGNGYIDHVKVRFSETIKGSSVVTGAAKNTISPAIPSWMFTGYTGEVKLNLFEDNDAGKDAAVAANMPVFAGQTENDDYLFFKLEEDKVPAYATTGLGSTNWLPVITWGTGANAVKLIDIAGNVLDTASTITSPSSLKATNGTVVDLVGPRIMSATYDAATRTILVKFSEDVDDRTQTYKCIDWDIRNTYEWAYDAATNALTFPTTTTVHTKLGAQTWPNAGTAQLTLVDGFNWSATIAYGIQISTDGTVTTNGDFEDVKDNIGTVVAGDPSSDASWYWIGNKFCPNPYAQRPVENTLNMVLIQGIPSLDLTAPAAPTVMAGQAVDITWKATNVDSVDVWYSKNLGISYTKIAGARVAASAGKYTWNIMSGVNKVKVTSAVDEALKDESGTITVLAGEGGGGGTVGAPSNLVLTDVPNDNGHWMFATFTVPTEHLTSVKSYQFYREVEFAVDDTTTVKKWVYSAVVPAGYAANGQMVCLVPSILNGESRWAVVASTSDVLSDIVAAAKEADVAVAMLVDAEKAAEVVLSAMSEPAVGGPVDNIAPSPIVTFSADDNEGEGTGILLSWTAPEDHGLVGYYGWAGVGQFPIYGVTEYQVFRKEGDGEFTLVGSAAPLSTSYIDVVADASTVYTYMVKAVDSAHEVATSTKNAIAFAGGADFTSDGVVGLGDLVVFGAMWNAKSTDANWVSAYDLNKDGSIGLGDLVLLGASWTSSKVAKEALPITNDVTLGLSANYDDASATYFVNINVSEADGFNGVGFTLNYDAEALELVQGGVNGIGAVSVTKETEAGMVDVNSYFMDGEFTGTITVAFQSKGMNKDLDFELVNASVSIDNVINAVSDLGSVTLKAIPTVYALRQNFPNPFNPTTTIEYSIPQSGNVNLVIYNMAGQKVRTLVNELQLASYKKVVWDGKNDMGETVGAGMYFYKLVSGNFSKIQKMTLIK